MASLEEELRLARQKGCDVAVGGGLTVEFAHKYDLHGVEILIPEEEIVSTIENARSVARSNRKERAKTERYRCIIDAVSEGVIAVDQNGVITTINKERPLGQRLGEQKRENEKMLIQIALEKSHYAKGRAARMLGISRTTLWKKLRDLQLD